MNLKSFFKILLLFLIVPQFSFAQRTQLNYPQFPGIPAWAGGVVDFFRYLYQIFLAAGAILAFGFFLWGGFLYLTSAGNPARMGKAKELMTSSLLGLFILFASYTILSTIDPSLVIFGIQISTFRVPRVSLQLPPVPEISSACKEILIQKTFEGIQELERESLEIIKKIKDSIYDDPNKPDTVLARIMKEIEDLISQCQCEKISSQCLKPDSGAWLCPSQCPAGQNVCPPELEKDLIPKLKEKLNTSKELIEELNKKIRRLTELRIDYEKYLVEISQCRQDKSKHLFICSEAKYSGLVSDCNGRELNFYCCQ